ncbi:MAG TPA: dihydropteroate synthase, partial [Cytophagales bacterium]|nr:dihydropteroate synthase [Cytophagales bacterium]
MCLNSVAKDSLFSQKKTLNIQGTLVSLETPRVMGILNVTPDSFYSGSRVATEEAVLRQAEKFVQEGAFFLDIGGYSSRPGADDVPLEEELVRTIPAIEAVVREFPEVYVSVDTF